MVGASAAEECGVKSNNTMTRLPTLSKMASTLLVMVGPNSVPARSAQRGKRVSSDQRC